MQINKPFCLVLDIETAPNIAYIFDIKKEQRVTMSQIIQEEYIMAWSAKWLGDPVSKLIYRETRNGNDKAILQELWYLLDKADIVVTQNGQSFDLPKIEARMRIHGIKPFSPIVHYDTYKANKRSGFLSHKLEYLTEKLNKKYKKLHRRQFPGLSLWIECLKGNKKAWAEMKCYNIQDTLSTEELYLNTREWAHKKWPSALIPINKPQCPYCNGYNLRSLGLRGGYRRYICGLCGRVHQREVQ